VLLAREDPLAEDPLFGSDKEEGSLNPTAEAQRSQRDYPFSFLLRLQKGK